MRGLCFQCGGPLGSARATVIDDGSGYEQVCGPKCEKAFADGQARVRLRLVTADDLDLAAGQAEIEGPSW